MGLATFLQNAVCGSLKVTDGTGTSLVVPYEQGDFSFGELLAILNEEVVYESRGKLRGIGVGARIFPEIGFTAWIPELTNASVGVLYDFLLKRGAYAALTSTLGASHPIYCVHLDWISEATNFGGDADQTLRFQNFRPRMSGGEAIDGNSMAIKGKAYGAVLLNGSSLAAEVA